MPSQQPPVLEEQLASPSQFAQVVHWVSGGEAVDIAGIIINTSTGGMFGEGDIYHKPKVN